MCGDPTLPWPCSGGILRAIYFFLRLARRLELLISPSRSYVCVMISFSMRRLDPESRYVGGQCTLPASVDRSSPLLSSFGRTGRQSTSLAGGCSRVQSDLLDALGASSPPLGRFEASEHFGPQKQSSKVSEIRYRHHRKRRHPTSASALFSKTRFLSSFPSFPSVPSPWRLFGSQGSLSVHPASGP